MLGLIAVVLIVTYPLLATRGARRGRAALLAVAAATLFVIGAATWLIGLQYDVPNPRRLLLYAYAATAPVVLIPTALLLLKRASSWTPRAAFSVALLAAVVGGVCGWLIVIYGLRAW